LHLAMTPTRRGIANTKALCFVFSIMSKPILQHWVPRFYLRHFATPDTRNATDPLVWFLSKDAGDPRLTSTRTIAAQRYLYSPRDTAGNLQWGVDEKLTDLEGTLASIWPLLANDFVDLHGDITLRKAVALFVSVLHLRHPNRLVEIERLHTQMVAAYESCPKDERGRPLAEMVYIDGAVRPFDNSNWREYRAAGANEKKQMFVNSILQNALHCAEILLKKRWSIVFADEPLFITTDKPVTVIHQTRSVFGMATPGTIISFPLSPTRVLMMDDRHEQPKGQYYPLASTGAAPANFTAWRHCERFMISHRPPDSVCAELLAYVDGSASSIPTGPVLIQ
jgi:hypothetical protein